MKEHPANQTNGTWTRKILVHQNSNKPLVLHDHRDCGSVTIVDTITRADVAGETDDPISFLDHVANRQPAQSLPELHHLVCHIRPTREGFPMNPDSREGAGITPLFGGEAVGKKVIAIQCTTRDNLGTASEFLTVAGNEYVWLSMNSREAYRKVDLWLPEFMDLDFATAKLIAEATDRGALDPKVERKYAHLLDITHPGDATAELAFRLLCEAVVLCKGEATAKVGGIPITAATQLGQWLDPFSPTGMPEDQRIDAVVSLMGSEASQIAAREVLTAVKANTGVLEAAQAFPGVPASTATQQETEEAAQ